MRDAVDHGRSILDRRGGERWRGSGSLKRFVSHRIRIERIARGNRTVVRKRILFRMTGRRAVVKWGFDSCPILVKLPLRRESVDKLCALPLRRQPCASGEGQCRPGRVASDRFPQRRRERERRGLLKRHAGSQDIRSHFEASFRFGPICGIMPRVHRPDHQIRHQCKA